MHTTAEVQKVFEQIRGLNDKFVETGRDYDKFSPDNKSIVGAVARINFNAESNDRTVSVVVYEDGTFSVPTCACASRLETVAAYHRAFRLIEVLNLKDS